MQAVVIRVPYLCNLSPVHPQLVRRDGSAHELSEYNRMYISARAPDQLLPSDVLYGYARDLSNTSDLCRVDASVEPANSIQMRPKLTHLLDKYT